VSNYDNPFQNPNPIMSGLFRAAQLHNLVEENKRQQQEVELRRNQQQWSQQHAADLLDQERRRVSFEQTKDNAEQELKLNQLGAQRDNPQLESILDAAFGRVQKPRMMLKTTAGNFYLPTAQEQDKRALEMYTAKQNADEKAKYDAKPKIPLPKPLAEKLGLPTFFGLPNITEDALRDYATVSRYLNPEPKTRLKSYTDARGNVTEYVIDSDGNTIKETRREGVGKPSRTTTGANEKAPRLPTTRELSGAIGRVQSLINKARLAEANGSTTSETLWQSARDAARQTAEMYPDDIEAGGLETGQATYIKLKPGRDRLQSRAQKLRGGQATAPAQGQRQIISKAQYDAFVQKHGKATADSMLKKYNTEVQ